MSADNELATLHLLSTNDTIFFTKKLNSIKERIDRICEENKLDGNWTLSKDFKFLIKITE